VSVLLPVQREVEAEEYGEPGTDFMSLARALFALKPAKVGISGALRCCGCLVKGVALPHALGTSLLCREVESFTF